MRSQFVFIVALVALSFAFIFGDKVIAVDCCATSKSCGNTCQAASCGSYLYDKSIFDSPLFENYLIGKKSRTGIYFYGWMLTGITVNNHGATNEYNGSAYEYNNRRDSAGNLTRPGMSDRSGNSYVLMLEQPSDWKVNQLWWGARKDLDDHLGIGFQADFTYGTDGRYSRNHGNRSFDYHWGSGDYFASFAQCYGTVGTKDLFAKVGKFAGGFSYEGMAAPREYFYTHAHICYGRPLTAHGAMLEWHPNKKWMLTGGWLAGVFNDFENPYGDNAFLGKATYNFTKSVSLTYKIFYNDRGARPQVPSGFPPQNNGQIDAINTLILTWKINKCWSYMGEIAYNEGHLHHPVNGKLGNHAWGINNHLIRTFTEKFSVGVRGEYHYSHASMFDQRTVSGGQGGDLWQFTLASHYKITPKTTFRPEIRYDYTDYRNGYRPFGGDESKSDQISGGVSVLVMF